MKSTFKLKDYEKYLVEKFLSKGECNSPAALAAVLRYCEKDIAASAILAFKNYCWKLEYINPTDYAQTAQIYKTYMESYCEGTPEYYANKLGAEIFSQRVIIETSKH